MQKNREKFLYLFLGTAMTVFLFSPGWALNKFIFGLDTFTLHMPFLIYAKKMWAVFHSLPLWMPDIYMGMPAIDSANLIYFYPTNLLFTILPVPAEQTYLIDMIIHMAAAVFGMYIFLMRHDIDKQASYFGALLYIFSAPFITSVYNGHWNDIKAMALVPFVFYFINRAIKEKKLLFYFSAAIFMAFQVLGLGMQIAVYTYMGVIFYGGFLLYRQKTGKIIRPLVFFLLMTAAVAVLSAPQFFSSLDYMGFSWRKEFSYDGFIDHSFNPLESIVFLLPYFFGLKDSMYWGFFPGSAMSYYCGLLPFLLAPFAFFSGRNKNSSGFFLCLAVFFIIMAFGGNTWLYKILYYIPVFNKFRNPAAALCMIPFMFSFIAAAGLNAILPGREDETKTLKIFKKIMIAIAVISTLLVPAVAAEKFLKGMISAIYSVSRAKITNQPVSPENLTYITGLIRQDVLYFVLMCGLFTGAAWLVIKNKIRSATAVSVIFCLLQFFDIQRVDKKFISYESVKNAAPADEVCEYMKKDKSYFRYADLDFAWTPNRNMYHGLESFIGFHAILHDKMYNILAREDFARINIMRVFNVKYYLSAEATGDYKIQGLKKVVDGRLKLFEDTKVMPRAFLTDKIRQFPGDDEILKYMETDNFDPQEVLVKDSITLKYGPENTYLSARITEYTPNRIRISTNAGKETMLVLSNMYYHRWKAAIDGKKCKIYNVDYVVMAIVMPPGTHVAEFYYDGRYILFYVILLIAGFIGIAAVYFFNQRSRTNKVK